MANNGWDSRVGNDEFTMLALSALTEAARRAAISYQRRGHLLACWNGSQVEWTQPEEMLRHLERAAPAESVSLPDEHGAASGQSPDHRFYNP